MPGPITSANVDLTLGTALAEVVPAPAVNTEKRVNLTICNTGSADATFDLSRYDVAGADWIFGANMIWLAVTALAINRAAGRDGGRAGADDGRVELGILSLSAVLSMLAAPYSPDNAMYFYLLNLASPLVKRAAGWR